MNDYKKQVVDDTDDFDLGGQDADDQPIKPVYPSDLIQLPPQQSATDTSNWDDRVSIAPDGKEHIKDLGADDSVTKK